MANTRAIIDVQINTGQAASALRGLQAQLNSFQSALNTNNRVQASAAKNLASELSEMVNAGGFFTAETVRMQTAASRLDKTLQKGQGTIGDFWNARFRKGSTQAAAVLSLANARASALETQFVATGGAANGFRDSIAIRPLQAFNSQAAVSAQKLAIHRAMLTQSTTSMINFGKNTQWAGRQLMVGFTVPLTIFAATAGKAFREIEKEAVNFRKVYGDAFTLPEEMEANLEAVKGLAKEYTKYGIAVKDTIGLAAQAAAAGSQGEELISATTEATRLATLGQMDQNQALETTIALQTAFGLQAQDLTKTINFLNMVENQTVVTLQDLAQAIPRVAPVIKGLGGSVEDMAAMLAAMQEGGVSAAQGANALKSGLASLINPTNRAIEKLEEMGVNLNYIVQTNRGDLMGTVQAFAQALSTLDEFQQQQALEKVFGKFQYARLGALFNNIIKDGSQASRVMDTAALSASQLASSAEKELGAIEESAATKFTAAMERLKLAIAPIGEMFTEMAIPVLGFLGKLVDKFNELPDFAKKFIGFGSVITGLIIPAGTMFLGLLMNLVGTLIKFGNVVGVAFKGFMTGGIKGAIQAVTQTLGYMSLAEIDAATAARQLGDSTEFVNMALRDQPLAAGAASTAVDELAASYQILASRMMDASRASVAGGAFAVPGAAMTKARGGASNLVGRPLPIVARNSGGTIPGVGNKDTVPAVLTPGEFVVNKKATQENFSLLHAINSGKPVSMLNTGGAAGMTAAMQRVLARVQTQRQEAATIPIAMGGRGGTRKTQAANAASSRNSQDIYGNLTGNYERGRNVRVDTLRFAVEKLGFSPEQLGLKTRGNLTFRMSKDSNLAMMRGDLTRDRLLKELNTPDVYSPLAKQLDSYLGAKLDRSIFDRIYKEEILKLPMTGITNGRFEKASRNAVRRYLDSAGFPKTRRNSFIRDILQGDTVNANMSLPAIKQSLDSRGIKYTPGSNKKDLYVDIDGRQVNIGNLAGREIGNLGRPEGVLDYAGLRGSGEAVHANKGGLIPEIQGLFRGGVARGAITAYGGFHRTGRPRTDAPSSIYKSVAEPYGTEHQSEINKIIIKRFGKEFLNSPSGRQMREANVAHRQLAKVDPKRGKVWEEKDTFGAFGAENKGLEYLFGQKRRTSREIFLEANKNLQRKEKEIFNKILQGKHPDTKEELLVFNKMLKNVDSFVEGNPTSSWKDGQGKLVSVASFKKSSAYKVWKPVLGDVVQARLSGKLGGYRDPVQQMSLGGVVAAANAARGARGRIPKNIVDWFSKMTTSINQSTRDDLLQNIPANIRRGLSTSRKKMDITRGSIDPMGGGDLKEVSSWTTGGGVGRFIESSRLFDTMYNSKFQIAQRSQNMKKDIDWLKTLGPDGPDPGFLYSPFNKVDGGLNTRLTPQDIEASGGVIWKANKKKLEERIQRDQEFIAGHQKIINDLQESYIPTIYRTSVKKGEKFFDVSGRIVPRDEQRINNPAASNEILDEKEVALLGARLTGRPKTRIVEREEAQERYDKAKEEIKKIRMAIVRGEISRDKAKPDLDRLYDESENMASFVNWGRGREVSYPNIVSRLNMGGQVQALVRGGAVLSSLTKLEKIKKADHRMAYVKEQGLDDILKMEFNDTKTSSPSSFLNGMFARWERVPSRPSIKENTRIARKTGTLKYPMTPQDEYLADMILSMSRFDDYAPDIFKPITVGKGKVYDGHTRIQAQLVRGLIERDGKTISSMSKDDLLQAIDSVKRRSLAGKIDDSSILSIAEQQKVLTQEASRREVEGMSPRTHPKDRRHMTSMFNMEGRTLVPGVHDRELSELISAGRSAKFKGYGDTDDEILRALGFVRLGSMKDSGYFHNPTHDYGSRKGYVANTSSRIIRKLVDQGKILPLQRNMGGIIPQMRNTGGQIFDSTKTSRTTVPGAGNKDTVPAVLTPGEFVINKKAARNNIDILHAINSGQMIAPGYQSGTSVVDAGYIEQAPSGKWLHKNSDGSVRASYASQAAAYRGMNLHRKNLQEQERKSQRRSKAVKRTKQPKVQASQEKKASSMQSRMGMGMGLGMAGGAMMMAPMIPGIGENASLSGALSGAGMGMSLLSILPMLGMGGPLLLGIGAAGAGLIGLGMAIKNNIESQDEASKKALELGSNLGGTANSLKKMSDVLGIATPAEKQAQLQLGLSDDSLKKAAAEFSDIIQTEGFQEMITELKEATSAERMTKLTDYLRNAVAAGMMKEEDARKLAKVIGLMLQDTAVGSGVAAAIKGQATGPQALLGLASGRSTALEGTKEMRSMRAGEEFTKFGGQEASKIIGGAFQIIQDAANAEALARQQFAEGVISYETYSNVIEEAESLQIKYNDAINNALLATNDFGSTMNSVRQMLIDGGFITEEALNSVSEAAKSLAEQGETREKRMTTNPESIQVYDPTDQKSKTILSNDLERYQEAILTGISASEYGSITVAQYAKTMEGNIGEAENTSESLKNIQGDLAAAVVQNQSGAINYADIVKRMAGDKEKGIDPDVALQEIYTKFSGKEGVTASEAFDATILTEQIMGGQIPGLGRSVKDKQVSVDVMTSFVTQGGDPATFQTFLLSIPEEKRLDVRTAFEDMDQAEREAWINDFNEIQTILGPDSEGLATEITLSAKYQEGGEGTREGILNGVKQFNDLPAFVEKEAIYALETNDGKNPLSRKEAEERVKSYNKLFKDMGSKDKSVRQAAEIELASRYNGKPITQKQMNGITKDVKNWNNLDTQSREEIIFTTFDVQANFKINGEFYGLEGVDATAPLEEIKKQIEIEMESLETIINTTIAAGGDASVAEASLAKYEKAWGIVNEGIQRVSNISSGGPSGKKSGSGSGGSGAKSLAQQLTEDLKMATDILKNLRNVIDTNGFKAFIAGPFAPEFIDYLRQQGEEGLKVLKGGLNKIKTEYEKYRKLRSAEIITEATIAPMLRDQSVVQAFTSSAFKNQLTSGGLRGSEADFVMEQVPQEQVDELVALRQERSQLLKGGVTGEEKKRLEEVNTGIKAITTNIKNATRAAKELTILSELDGAAASIMQAGEANSDFAQMLSSGIDPTTATMYQELGLSFDAVNVKGKKANKALTKLTEAARSMKVAESIRSTIDALNGMSQDLKLTQTLASQGFTGEFAEELKTLGINAFSSAEQIAAAANGLKAMKLMQTLARTETEKLNIALENQNRALQAQIEAYQRNSIKPLEDQLQAINDIISAKQRDIEMEERKKEPYEKDIEALEEQKDSLKEVYDQRIEALEKVSQINEKIAQQEKNQLDVASALSRGDIAGAAQAALQAQQQAAQSRIDEARDAIGGQYEDDQLSIEDQIKGKRDEIKKIDEEIDRIQGDIRKKQDEAYNKQIDINNAKKEEAKMQEKMYKLQLLQSMAQTQADIRKAAQAGDTQAVGFLQQQLGSQLAIAGTDQASQEAFFNPVEGGRGVVQASYNDLMGKTPGDLVSQAMVDILPTIDGFRNVIMQGFSLQDATNPQSSMPAALRQLVQSAYNTAEEFKNPTTGLPYTTGEIVNVLGQNGALGILQPFVQNEFDGSIKNMGTMLQGVSEKMVGIGSIVDDIVEGFRGIRARIRERIESAQDALVALHNKITEANNTKIQVVTEVRYVNSQKKMFGGNVNYRGSTEKAPGLMYGGKMKGYAYGSVVPGTGMTDKVPALLTPGEFVIRKSVAQEYGPLLTAINSNVFPRMNTSGAMPKNSSNTKDGVQYNYEVNVNVAGSNASPDEIANTVMYKIKRMDDRQIRGTSIG